MKKIITFTVILLLIISSVNKTEAYTIPNEAIRLRVIANSNDTYDQKIKMKVSNQIQTTMYNLLKDVKGIESARDIVNNKIDIIDKDIKKVLQEENYKLGYKINFGYNYFPEKKYKDVTYNEGYYESVLVTLGKGEGNNWWCVLFPPLCLLEAEEEKSKKVEYKSFIKEIIEKYL